MTHSLRSISLTVACALWAAAAGAQTTSTAATQTSSTTSQSSDASTRPATTTYFGDTGLWFVPTAEVVPHGRFSVSGYRTNWDYRQGLTDVSHFPITFAGGIGDRAEIFGSFRVDTRIDRDLESPTIFRNDAAYGGLVNDHPFVRKDWSGDNVGDLFVGVKFNLMSEWRQQPAAIALRAIVKLPTGNKDSGAGTGKADALIDFIISKEFNRAVELRARPGSSGAAIRPARSPWIWPTASSGASARASRRGRSCG